MWIPVPIVEFIPKIFVTARCLNVIQIRSCSDAKKKKIVEIGFVLPLVAVS